MIYIYGKELCPYCVTAKKLCKANNIKFKYLHLGKDYDEEKVQKLMEQTGQRTFPFVFRGVEFIGGAKELQQELRRA